MLALPKSSCFAKTTTKGIRRVAVAPLRASKEDKEDKASNGAPKQQFEGHVEFDELAEIVRYDCLRKYLS